MKRLSLAPLALLSAALVTGLGCSSSQSDSGGSGSGGKAAGSGAVSSAGSGVGGAGGATAGGRGGGGAVAGAGGSGPASGGATGAGGTGAAGGGGQSGGSGGQMSAVGGTPGGGGLAVVGGMTSAGGTAGDASSGAAGMNAAGTTAMAGAGGACVGAACGVTTCLSEPTLPGAVKSPLYTVTGGDTSLFVEKMTKFGQEMQVHYAHCTLTGPGSATFSVTVGESFSSYTLSPKSRNITAAKSGNTITFDSGPNYFIVQFDTKELLFVLVNAPEDNPPKLGDANVKNLADYNLDSTGATLVTSKLQSAIDAATGATQNVLYVPPGKYKTGELWLKSDMTLYLAAGALLYGSGATGDFNTGAGGVDIEDCTHGMIRMYKIKNTKILGRGVIDGNGLAIRAQNDTKINLLKIEESSNILIDGIIVRDPSFWNTLVYRSDLVTLQNYKMINCRPTTTTYNNTDGVDFDESTNGVLSNAFLYTGDDSMATKNEMPDGTINTKNILHEKVVCYSNSVCAKIGTKTMGQTIDGVTFRDIDVVKAGRALNIDAYDTAVVQNTTFENVRIEAADTSTIALSEDEPPTWRTAANTSVTKDTYFTNVTSDVKQPINLHGSSATVNIAGVHFKNLMVQGKAVTSQTDPDASWSINSYVTNITFE